jgi:hypothetical protein
MDGFELATLDTLQHGLTRHPERADGLAHCRMPSATSALKRAGGRRPNRRVVRTERTDTVALLAREHARALILATCEFCLRSSPMHA